MSAIFDRVLTSIIDLIDEQIQVYNDKNKDKLYYQAIEVSERDIGSGGLLIETPWEVAVLCWGL